MTMALAVRMFEGDTSAVALARHWASDVLGEWRLRQTAADDVILLLSELVTNAVVHARSSVRVSLEQADGSMRIAVRDDDRTLPTMPDPPATMAPNGRGLRLVHTLATAWGTDQLFYCKVVWFEIPIPRTDAGSDPDPSPGFDSSGR